MAKDPYIPFDWPNIGEPLVPFIAIKFRGPSSFYHTFPDKLNRIYIADATFDVLDDSGYSTASISLVDPDFYNLENIFIKALFLANSMVRGQGNWYCAAFWGWSYYGNPVGERSRGQRKTSGIHYYMLRDLSYDLTDVDLRVTLNLMDIGASIFEGDDNTKVGLLNVGNGVSRGYPSDSADGSASGEYRDEKLLQKNIREKNEELESRGSGLRLTDPSGEGTDVDIELAGGGPSAAPTAEGTGTPNPEQNIITGKSYWEIIQLVSRAHYINSVARILPDESPSIPPTDGPTSGEGGGKTMSQEYGKYIIAQEDILTDVVDDLLTKIDNQPAEATVGTPTKRWGMLAGAKLSPKPNDAISTEPDLDVPFGWIPQPPKGSQNVEDNYRLARVFTYRPGNKNEIARGETMITNLRYDWTSKGYWGLGLPMVYAQTADEEGVHSAYLTLDDFANYNPDEITRIKSDPSVKKIPLEELTGRLGIEVEFNFDNRTDSDEKIELGARAVIINVWNFFLQELVNLTIDIAGDPWLDNQIFNSDGSASINNLLVDLYGAYFKVKVYKLSPGSHQGKSAFLSEILSGNYLCLKGCSHRISDGDYSTSLQLMKAF